MARLIIRENGRALLYEICEDSVLIGAGADCNIVLKEAAAARSHCLVRRAGRGFELIDLETKLGTRVNGTFLNQKLLEPGDRIEIGEASIVYEGAPAGPEKLGPPESERLRVRRERRRSLPADAVGAIVVLVLAPLTFALFWTLTGSASTRRDEAILEEARALREQTRYGDALAKLAEIESIPPAQRSPRVAREKPEEEARIRGLIEADAERRAVVRARDELSEIAAFALAHPADGDEIRRQLEAWEVENREHLAEMPSAVATFNALRERFPRRNP